MLEHKVVRYILSGGAAALTNLSSFFILVHLLSVHYLIASVLAFSAGIVASFTLHKFWTFNDQEVRRIHFQLASYLGVTFGNLALNTLLVYLFVTWLGFWYLLAQILAGALIAVSSYFIYRGFVFGSQEKV